MKRFRGLHIRSGNWVYMLFVLLLTGAGHAYRADDSVDQPSQQTSDNPLQPSNEGIEKFIKLEKLSERETKRVATRYRLQVVKPVSLKRILTSELVSDLLAIGASVKFEQVSQEMENELQTRVGVSLTPVVVSSNQEEFTHADEIVFFVYFPAARN